jgi:hypothetical protein
LPDHEDHTRANETRHHIRVFKVHACLPNLPDVLTSSARPDCRSRVDSSVGAAHAPGGGSS